MKSSIGWSSTGNGGGAFLAAIAAPWHSVFRQALRRLYIVIDSRRPFLSMSLINPSQWGQGFSL